MKKIVTMLLVCVMVLGLFAGCGNGSTQQTTAATTAAPAADATEAPAQETEAAPDTIVIMAPPVTGNYLENLKT